MSAAQPKEGAAEKKEEPEQAKSLEEGLEAAAAYEGDPLDCPCIAHMKEGPCGGEFVVAYKCFLDSKEEEKGSDCIESFRAMQLCFQSNPEYYDQFLKDADDDDEEEEPLTREEMYNKLSEEDRKEADKIWHDNAYKLPADAYGPPHDAPPA
eukprot:CAMPEP_0173419990 /NCGR_PEP_ID=MMETSP1357-20121228/1639_1 /TAXON_ID=77926 /ORGANISM="Hemiselmis rufescens, Strain PCC563" /LENGTH=151 /DNA_ID=CAMNT_0014382725 /DNA_START=6 /DNA_END=458 /DNA_ORIENTATION=+